MAGLTPARSLVTTPVTNPNQQRLTESSLNPYEEARKLDNQFSAGVGSGIRGLKSNSKAYLGQLAKAAGMDGAGQQLLSEADAEQEFAARVGPRVGSYADVDSVDSALDYGAGMMGQGLASGLPVAAAAIATRAAGLRGLPQVAASGTPVVLPMAGETVQSVRDDPEAMRRLSDAQLAGLGAAGGVGGAMLEAAVPSWLVGKAFKKAVAPGVKSGITSTAKDVATSIPLEGVSEVASSELNRQVVGALNPNRDTTLDNQNRVDEFLGGALGAAPISLPTALAANAVAATQNAKQAVQNIDVAQPLADLATKASNAMSKATGSVSDWLAAKTAQVSDPVASVLNTPQTVPTDLDDASALSWMAQDDNTRNAAAVTQAQNIMNTPDASPILKTAAQQFMAGSKTSDAWKTMQEAVSRDARVSAFKRTVSSLKKRIDSGVKQAKDAVENRTRKNEQAAPDPFQQVLTQSLTPHINPDADTLDVADITIATRAWITKAAKNREVEVPREFTRLYSNPVQAVRDAYTLMARQGLVENNPEVLEQFTAEIQNTLEAEKAESQIVTDNLLPTVSAQYKFDADDVAEVAGHIRTMIKTGKFDDNALSTMFGPNKERVLAAFEKTTKLDSLVNQAADDGAKDIVGDSLDDEQSAAYEELAGITNNALDPNTVKFKTRYEGEYDSKRDGSVRGANTRSDELKVGEGRKVSRIGYIDYLREEYGDRPNEFIAKTIEFVKAKQGLLESDADKADPATALNKRFFRLKVEEATDELEALEIDGAELNTVDPDSRNNVWGVSLGEGNKYGTIEHGKLYFERLNKKGKVDEETGEVMPTVFATSTTKLMGRMQRAKKEGSLPSQSTGVIEQGELLSAGITSLLAAAKDDAPVLSGRIGVRETPNSEVRWLKAGESLPAGLKMYGDATVGDIAKATDEKVKTEDEKALRDWYNKNEGSDSVQAIVLEHVKEALDSKDPAYIKAMSARVLSKNADNSDRTKEIATEKETRTTTAYRTVQPTTKTGKPKGKPITEKVTKTVTETKHLTETEEMARAAEERENRTERKFDEDGIELHPRESRAALEAKRDELEAKRPSAASVSFILDNLRKGVPAFNAAIKPLNAERLSKVDSVLSAMLAAKTADNPIWRGNPPKDMEAFAKRARVAQNYVRGLISLDTQDAKQDTKQDTLTQIPTVLKLRFNTWLREDFDTEDRAVMLAPENEQSTNREFLEEFLEFGEGTEQEIALAKAALNGSADTAKNEQTAPDAKIANDDRLVNTLKERITGTPKQQVNALFDELRTMIDGFTEQGPFGLRLTELEDSPTSIAKYLNRMFELELSLRDVMSPKQSDSISKMLQTLFDAFKRRYNKHVADFIDTVKNEQTTPEANELSDADMAQVRADVVKRLGKGMKVEFAKLVGTNGEAYSGEWEEGIIRVSINAANPTQIGAHEAMHELFNRLLLGTTNNTGDKQRRVQTTINVLLNAANSASVVNQLNRLLDAHPNALKQIKEGSPNYMEERLAYMYQFHAAGLLNLGPETKSVFKRIAEFLRKVTGLLSEDQAAELLLQAFSDGKLQDADAAAEVIASNVEYRYKQMAAVGRALEPVTSAIGRFALPAEHTLESADNAALKKVNRLFKNPTGEAGVQQSFFEAKSQKTALYLNKLSKLMKGMERADLDLALRYLREGKEPHNERAKTIYNEVRTLLDEMETYLRDADVRKMDSETREWVPLGHIENYFPRSYDIAKISADPAKFIDALVTHHRAELENIAKQGMKDLEADVKVPGSYAAARALETGKLPITAEDVATAITDRMINSVGNPDLNETTASTGYSPVARAVNSRSLDWLDDSKFHEWLNDDLVNVVSSYVYQGVKRAEYTRRFGHGGEGLTALMEEAFEIEKDKAIAAKEADPDLVAVARMKSPAKAIMAMEGTLGYDINPKLRRLQGTLLAYENIRILPLALFSSLIDPLGIAIRGGDMKQAWKAYTKGLKEVWATWKGEKSTDRETEIAEMLGTVDASGFLASFGQAYSSMYLHEKVRNANEELFRWNGLDGFNRGVRIQATQAAISFLKKHKTNPDEHSTRYLDELLLTPDDIEIDEAGDLNYEDPKIQVAIKRWVDGAVLRPNAAQRPAWMSDPHFAIFGHMKSFSYTFHDTIMKRAWIEMKEHGNLGPMGVLLGTFTPMMVAADAAKAILLTGQEPTWMQGGLPSMIEHGALRAGLLGMASPYADPLIAGHPASILGPTAEQAISLFTQPLGESAVDALPGASIINTYDSKASV